MYFAYMHIEGREGEIRMEVDDENNDELPENTANEQQGI
jgi:hypothetical protein